MKKSTVFIIVGIVIGIAGILLPFYLHQYGGYTKTEMTSLLEWIGSFSVPFFSFSTIMILVGTLYYQREDARVQKFDDTLFNLINLNHEIVNSIDLNVISDDKHGRECFKEIYENFYQYCNKHIGKDEYSIIDTKGYQDLNRELVRVYEEFFEFFDYGLGHYFRNLYHIFKYIDKEKTLSKEEKEYYASLVRAQLSSYELLLIFYNVMSCHGREKFKPLVSKYDILQNMNYSKLVNEKHIEVFDRYN